MAGEKNSLVLLMEMFVLAAAMVVQKLAATTYHVGDSSSWKVQTGGLTLSKWAAQHTSVAGDVLVFDFTTGQRTAAQVTRNDYDNCNLANPITIQKNGPANYSLSSGASYHICILSNHCSPGQKLAVNAASSCGSPPSSPEPHLSPGSPSGSTTYNTTTTSPPPPSSATPTAIASASSIALSIFMTLFCY